MNKYNTDKVKNPYQRIQDIAITAAVVGLLGFCRGFYCGVMEEREHNAFAKQRQAVYVSEMENSNELLLGALVETSGKLNDLEATLRECKENELFTTSLEKVE